MRTPFRRLCWSCWTRCHSILVPQKMRCLTLYHVCVCVLLFYPLLNFLLALTLFYIFDRLELFLILLDFHVSLKWFTACWISALSFPTWIWHCMQTRGNSLSSQWSRNIKKKTKQNFFMTYEWIVSMLILITCLKLLTIQTEFKVPVIGGGTPSSWWHQQQPLWQPTGLSPQLLGAGWSD